MQDVNRIEVVMVRELPGWLEWAGYGVFVGLTAALAGPTLVVSYILAGLGSLSWFGFVKTYRAATQLYNERSFAKLISELDDGTLLDEMCLSKDKVEENE